MSISARIMKLTSIYVIGEVLSMLASFISFPIFVRVLPKEEYGVMALVLGMIVIFEMFSSLGLRHATQRFYTFYKQQRFDIFYATTVYGSIVSGIVGGTVLYVVENLYLMTVDGHGNYAYLPLFAGLLVFTRVIFKMTGCIYRVRERSINYVIFSVAQRFCGMILAIVAVETYGGVVSVIGGLSIGEAMVAIAYFFYMVSDVGTPNGRASPNILREMIAYGMPLLISGLAGTILSLGDRYVIGYILSTDAVASYSVPYTLCQYLSGMMSVALQFAFVPVIMNEWNNGNKEGVRREIERVIRVYAAIAIPIVFGISALGAQFIDMLAGRKYLDAPNILPLIIAGTLLSGVFTPVVMGIQLAKQTRVIAALTWKVALFNVAANILLVPFIGLYGAAVTTFVSYLLLLWRGGKISRKYLPIKLPVVHIVKYTGCALAMFVVIEIFSTTGGKWHLAMAVTAGVLVFMISMLVVDRDVSRLFFNIYHKYVGYRGGVFSIKSPHKECHTIDKTAMNRERGS